MKTLTTAQQEEVSAALTEISDNVTWATENVSSGSVEEVLEYLEAAKIKLEELTGQLEDLV